MGRGARPPIRALKRYVCGGVTHPAHELKVTVSLGDELPVEGPGEGDVEDGVTGDLAGQHDALAHNDLHVHRPLGNSGRICPGERKKHVMKGSHV